MRKILLTTVAATAAVTAIASGIALADTVYCSASPCFGTQRADYVQGTTGDDEVRSRGGADTANGGEGGSDEVFGGRGKDYLYGDIGFDRTKDGDDEVHGGRGADNLNGAGYDDLLAGGRGPDAFDARENLFAGDPPIPGTDTVLGGGGDDYVSATDGAPDVIDCGPGNKDRAYFDAAMDTTENCERDHPQ